MSSAQALSSTRLWCQLAIIVLTATRKGEESSASASASAAADATTDDDAPLGFLNQAQADRMQTLTVRHGGLEWLTEALSSLLLEILAAAFATHADVLAVAKGTDPAAVGAAALELDAHEEGNGFSITHVDDGGRDASAVPNVPQELLSLLDVTLGLLFVAVRAPAAHRLLVSTAVVQEKTKALLRTLFQLLLLPHISKSQAETVLLTLTVLVRHEAKLRALARALPEYATHTRRTAAALGGGGGGGGLKWFRGDNIQPLAHLAAIIAEAEEGQGGRDEGGAADADWESDVAAAESDVLGTVAALQIFVADNAQLAAYLEQPKTRQLSFAAGTGGGGGGGGGGIQRVTAFSLSQYVDPVKAGRE